MSRYSPHEPAKHVITPSFFLPFTSNERLPWRYRHHEYSYAGIALKLAE